MQKIYSLTVFFCLVAHGISLAAGGPIRTTISLPLSSPEVPVMRVAVLQNVEQAHVEFSSPYQVKHPVTGDLLAQGVTQKNIIIHTTPEGIQIDGRLIRLPYFHVTAEDEMIQIEGKTYRARLRVQKNARGKLLLVNEINLDEYLKGVLPKEVDPRWPMEALQAQAVAARTFAMFQALKNPNAAYFLTSDVTSQVYGGKSSENSRASEAVEATSGQVMTYRGLLVAGYFHSSCGGRTTRVDSVWNASPARPLSGVTCGFCAGSKYDSWKTEVSLEDVRNKLNAHGYRFGPITRVEALDYDRSGRVKNLAIHHSAGVRKMLSSDFRLFVGAEKIRSTLAKFQTSGGKLFVAGKGWGHGVGMCQWGTKTMAERGWMHEAILRFYYPGIQMTQAYVSPLHASEENWFSKTVGTIQSWFGG
ncbi:MAG: SpoIID/LytB domain-containing protein [Candidatus Omnitrophica bacterium]|nr:SpoIID/LytB domain-containing protein [Candidatus Omnitrophota bacterium]